MSRLRFEIKGDANSIALPTYSIATAKVVQILPNWTALFLGVAGHL